MFWIILLIVAIVALIVSIILYNRSWEDVWSLIIFISAIASVFLILIVPSFYLINIININRFEKQKEYIENVVPTLESSDNYAITNARIELNGQLYDWQYQYENYRFFTLLPEKVTELEEIK